MKRINLFEYELTDDELTEINEYKQLLEQELLYESQDDLEEYNDDITIVPFTFEDIMIPVKSRKLVTYEIFEKVFSLNDKIYLDRNEEGIHIYIATSRLDLDPMGYIILNSAEFIEENPESLYDIWVEMLDEIRN